MSRWFRLQAPIQPHDLLDLRWMRAFQQLMVDIIELELNLYFHLISFSRIKRSTSLSMCLDILLILNSIHKMHLFSN